MFIWSCSICWVILNMEVLNCLQNVASKMRKRKLKKEQERKKLEAEKAKDEELSRKRKREERRERYRVSRDSWAKSVPIPTVSFLYWESMRNQELRCKQLSSLHHGPRSRSKQLSSMHHGRNDIHVITIPSLVIVQAPSTWIIFFSDLSTTSALVAKTPEALSWQKLQQEVSLIGFLHCCIDSIWYFCGIWTGEVGWNFFFCK